MRTLKRTEGQPSGRPQQEPIPGPAAHHSFTRPKSIHMATEGFDEKDFYLELELYDVVCIAKGECLSRLPHPSSIVFF